ncbi:MAG: deoxyribodipyrimidine photolyase [Deferribacteres bacterium]|nr:deoxyribodipyrimidine photolyase [Deferribacteres bacterium]
MKIPVNRITLCNKNSLNFEGDYVLYWMIANRRTTWNYSLQHAADYADLLQKPLVILEALRCGYPWASDRLHKFIIDGMVANQQALAHKPVTYYPYIEPEAGAGKGLLASLASRACVVITDDFPAFMLPAMINAAAQQVPVRMEKVDSNGLLPMRSCAEVFPTAYAFRRYIQKNLAQHLGDFPEADPLDGRYIPSPYNLEASITRRWPQADLHSFQKNAQHLQNLPIDHSVVTVDELGGALEASSTLQRFLDSRLAKYSELRNQVQTEVTSGLSPYLHFGHISVHEIFQSVAMGENWSPEMLAPTTRGNREGWWGMSAAAEAFLDELITWRELGFNMCTNNSKYAAYESLPHWALTTLAEHEQDVRPYVYTLQDFEQAQTHDALWNAAQVQLVREGRIHNYLRMVWGKKILEWTSSPREALAVMIELNNKYALDGRDPNSYSGIFWVLGRYDRAWGPERPVFGKIRYMSSDNTRRKMQVDDYIRKYS